MLSTWPHSANCAKPCAGWRSEGTGLVLVTHHLGDILPEIERVILMRGGRIVGDGPREELLTEAGWASCFRRLCASAATKSGCTAGEDCAFRDWARPARRGATPRTSVGTRDPGPGHNSRLRRLKVSANPAERIDFL